MLAPSETVTSPKSSWRWWKRKRQATSRLDRERICMCACVCSNNFTIAKNVQKITHTRIYGESTHNNSLFGAFISKTMGECKQRNENTGDQSTLSLPLTLIHAHKLFAFAFYPKFNFISELRIFAWKLCVTLSVFVWCVWLYMVVRLNDKRKLKLKTKNRRRSSFDSLIRSLWIKCKI